MIDIMSVTQRRDVPEAADFFASRRREGKTLKEAPRAHKRHLATESSFRGSMGGSAPQPAVVGSPRTVFVTR